MIIKDSDMVKYGVAEEEIEISKTAGREEAPLAGKDESDGSKEFPKAKEK